MKNIATTVNELREKGKSVIGCFPLYPPLELLHSMSITPVVLWELKDGINHTTDSDGHLQTYTCSVARCLMQTILDDEAPLFDGLLMYNACDTLRNLPEIIDAGLADKGRRLPIFKLHIPAVPTEQTDGSQYLRKRFEMLINELEDQFKVRFSGEAFKNSTTLYHEMRRFYQEAEVLVAKGGLSFAEFTKIVTNGDHLPLEAHLESLKALIKGRFQNTILDKADSSAPKVMLSGIICPPSSLIDAIEKSGLRVVCNDLASMGRSYMYNPEPSDDPLAYYVDFYENHTPCTTLLPSADDRIQYLLNMAQNSAVDGVIFIGEKFCEHEYFEFPYLIKQFKEKGIQTLQLECSLDDRDNIGALRTRIDAFAEVVHGHGH